MIYGEHNAILPTYKALKKAKELGLDLVEIAPHADPPVCRICDYGKYKYDLEKQKKETPKHRVKTKEIKLRVGIGDHDYKIKMTRAENFLSLGDKLRVQLQFRGRENAHRELGFVVLKRVEEDLAGVGKVDIVPKLSGRQIIMMMSPLPEDQRKRRFKVEDVPDHVDFDADDSHFDDDDDDHDYTHGTAAPASESEAAETGGDGDGADDEKKAE